jgi:hypothetical protein
MVGAMFFVSIKRWVIMKLRNVLLGLTATIAMYSCSGSSLPAQTAAPISIEKAAIPALFAGQALVPGTNIDLTATGLNVATKTLTAVNGSVTSILADLVNTANGGKVYLSLTGKGSLSATIIDDGASVNYTAPAVGENSTINIFFIDAGVTNVVQIKVNSVVTPPPVNVGPQISIFTATPAVGNVNWNTVFNMVVSDPTVPADTLTCTVNFGDATPNYVGPCLASLNHTYATAGTYTATLSLSDGVNAPVTKTVTVVVNPTLAITSFTATTTPPTLNVATNYAFSGGTAPYTCVIDWDTTNGVDLTVFPGFQKTQTISPCIPGLLNKTYPFNGKFIANIKVTDSLGAMANKDVTINMNFTNNNPFIQILTVAPTPITLASAFANDPADVTNPFAVLTYTAQNVTVTTKATDLDPGDLLTCKVNGVVIPTCDNNAMTASITSPGTKAFTFDVADNFGGTATGTVSVVAKSAPAALLSATGLASGRKAMVQLNAADGDGDNLTCTVNFGDASSYSLGSCQTVMPGSVVHTYAAAGTYTVTLTVTDGVNPVTINKQVTVTN